MSKTEFKIEGEEQTVRFGALMSKLCVPYAVKNSKSILIFLEGDLGAGKTTFSRGFIEGCGYEDIVRSPTYTLVEPYDFSDYSIYHYDSFLAYKHPENRLILESEYIEDTETEIFFLIWRSQSLL